MKEAQESARKRRHIGVKNHAKILCTDTTHTLLYQDPVVQWISFLLRNNGYSMAADAFSFYIRQGISFSPLAMLKLCEDACILRQHGPLNIFTNHICEMLRDSHVRHLPIVDRLIQTLHIWAKQRAILRVGTAVITHKDIPLQRQQYRYILSSALTHYRIYVRQRPYNRKSSAHNFLQFLNGWLQQRVEDGSALDQYDIAMLLQGLSSLSLRTRSREAALTHELDAFIQTLTSMLSRYASSQVAILSGAEAHLDRIGNLWTSLQSSRRTDSLLHEKALQFAQNLGAKENKHHEADFASVARLARNSRVLKVLVRSHLHSGDIYSVYGYIKDMALVHQSVATIISSSQLKQASAGIGPTSPLNRFNARRFAIETQMRFTGTLVLTSSALLKTRDVSGLFSVLYFTRYLGSVNTFVRLWKRAIYLVAKQRNWEGATGLKALLSLLGESVPSNWDKGFVGSLLFKSTDLVISTLRTALQAPQSVVITLRPVPMDKDNFLLEDCPLTGMRKQSFDDWRQLVIPFGSSQWLPNILRSPSERVDGEERVSPKERSFTEINSILLKKIQRH
jgi:hypothetical protein